MKDIDYESKYKNYKYMYVQLKKEYENEFGTNEQIGGSKRGIFAGTLLEEGISLSYDI